ncbi:P2Y purinoceptor 2 [Biomphalaria glabrata]|nr:P2Y purinoceptor 2 [Biomphalaria glabrata]
MQDLSVYNLSLTPRMEGDRFVSDEVTFYLTFWVFMVTTNAMATWSTLSNVLNIIVFVKLGLKERVNFNLFCLSCSDLMEAATIAAMSVGFVGDVELLFGLMDGTYYLLYISWYRALFVDISSALTVFITIERCRCVVRPLTFNTSFIARRGKGIVFVILVFVLVNYLPLLTTFEFIPSESQHSPNLTIIIVTYSELNLAVARYNDLVFGITLAALCQFIIFVCALLMFRGLQKTSKVRSANVLKSNDVHSQAKGAMTSKERRVVKMILVLAGLYTTSCLPQMAYCWARVIIPDFADGKIGNLQVVLALFIYLPAIWYGALSVFVYYNFSSSYRLTCQEIFQICIG